MQHIQVPTVYLAGHDQGSPQLATPGSAGFDLPAILTRACTDRANQKRFVCWKGHRHDAWKMGSTPQEPRLDFDNVVQWLHNVQPAEVQKIKAMQEFPSQHLHLKINPGETIRVSLGIRTAIPEDKVILLYSRFSSAKKDYRLGNCVGVIDSDYRDEWFAAIKNTGTEVLVIQHGQRIVQGLIADRITADWPKVETLPPSQRAGGYGSTGDAPLAATEASVTPPAATPATDPMEAMSGEMTPQDAAKMAEQAGTMPSALDMALNEEVSAFDEPVPDTAAAAAVRDMIEEASPAEDVALDAAIAAEEAQLLQGVDTSQDASDPAPAPPETAPTAGGDVWEISLVCGNVQVGPVAKFRPSVHGPMFHSDGPAPVAGILMREIQQLAPRALPSMVDNLMQQSIQQGGQPGDATSADS